MMLCLVCGEYTCLHAALSEAERQGAEWKTRAEAAEKALTEAKQYVPCRCPSCDPFRDPLED